MRASSAASPNYWFRKLICQQVVLPNYCAKRMSCAVPNMPDRQAGPAKFPQAEWRWIFDLKIRLNIFEDETPSWRHFKNWSSNLHIEDFFKIRLQIFISSKIFSKSVFKSSNLRRWKKTGFSSSFFIFIKNLRRSKSSFGLCKFPSDQSTTAQIDLGIPDPRISSMPRHIPQNKNKIQKSK